MKLWLIGSIMLMLLFSPVVGAVDHVMLQQIPEGSGGFTREVVFQQSYTPTQPYGSNYGANAGGWDAGNNAFTNQKPSDYGQLVETGAPQGSAGQPYAGTPGGPNGLWIVDVTGYNRYPEMSLPINGYAREELTPGMEGYLTLEEMYPSGEVRTFSMGYVRPYHVYKMWFTADTPGTHQVRYNVNGYYSNVVRFYVQGSGPAGSQGWSNPAPSTGKTISRIGGSIVRGGGSSSFSSSGGSMSISTSFG